MSKTLTPQDADKVRNWEDDLSDEDSYRLKVWDLFSVKIKARHIKPDMFGVVCLMPDNHVFLNDIVYRRLSEDGKRVMFGLESHNTLSAELDEEMSVVPLIYAAVEDIADYRIRLMEAHLKGWKESCQPSADNALSLPQEPTFYDPFDPPPPETS